MNVSEITLVLFGSLILSLASGLPIAFCLAGVSIIFALILWGPVGLFVIGSSAFGTMNNFLLEAVPLFIFMGYVLQQSGIGDDFYKLMYNWMGPLRGGLAMGTVVVCTVFAAMAGVSGAATVTMGVIGIPAMLQRGYNKRLVLGSIAAGGGLGVLIPPSLAMILYGFLSGESIGRLFMAGIFPGLLLSGLFIGYIGIKCAVDKTAGPALPKEDRAGWKEKGSSLKAIILPAGIIVMVLGSIYRGVATPTEAAALGALGSIIAAVVNRRLSLKKLKEAMLQSVRTSSMVLWLVIGGYCFCAVYSGSEAKELLVQILGEMPLNRYLILIGIQLILLCLGMFIDAVGILMIATPVFVPVITELGFSPLWFGVLFTMNIEMGLLTPPLGINLFYLKGVSPPQITMEDLYTSIMPFVILHAIGLALIILFPQIALWLPSTMKSL